MLTLKHRGTTYSLGFGERLWRIDRETWRGPYGTGAALYRFGPLALWIDNLPPQTVGERGAW